MDFLYAFAPDAHWGWEIVTLEDELASSRNPPKTTMETLINHETRTRKTVVDFCDHQTDIPVMEQAYIVTGTLQGSQSVHLDEPVPIATERVRVTVQSLLPVSVRSPAEILDGIWARLKTAGHVPPSREEVEQRIQENRNSWN